MSLNAWKNETWMNKCWMNDCQWLWMPEWMNADLFTNEAMPQWMVFPMPSESIAKHPFVIACHGCNGSKSCIICIICIPVVNTLFGCQIGNGNANGNDVLPPLLLLELLVHNDLDLPMYNLALAFLMPLLNSFVFTNRYKHFEMGPWPWLINFHNASL